MTTKIFWMGLLLALPFSAGALGLGRISVDSFLDQPLNARIELVSLHSVEIDDIRVSLAEPAAFEKVGLERPFWLSQLRFTPEVGEDGRILIQVVTRQAVREPYLNFLVQVRWSGSSLLKEYTVLLDPPSYRSPAGAAIAKSDSRGVGQTARQDWPETYGPVRSSETLWVIARNNRPDRSLSVEQMMMALQRLNPTAFQHENVNLLRQGAVLQIPGREFIAEVSASEARTQFVQQTRDWRSMRNRAAAGSSLASAARQEQKGASDGDLPQVSPIQSRPGRVLQQVDGGKVESEQRIDRGENQLRVVESARQWTVGDQSGSAYSYPSDDEEKLREAIADSQQDLLAVREINRDLEELQHALEMKIQAIRNSLEEKDKVISRMKRLGATTEVQSDGVVGARGRATTRNADSRSVPTGTGTQSPKVAGMEPVPPLTEPGPTATPLQVLLQWVQANWMLLLVVAALLLLLLMTRVRRGHPAVGRNQEANSFRSYTELDQDLPGGDTSGQMPDSFRSYADEQGLFPEAGEDAASVLTKADIYLAYRQYDQAALLVRESIKDNPNSWMLKAKLLEIYAFRKDKPGFIRLLEEVHDAMAREEPGIWAKVVAMGRDLSPDHPLISATRLPGEQGSDASTDELLALEGAFTSSVVTQEEGLDDDDLPLLELRSGLHDK